jgi:5,10-methylenetetrahydrofolate reductase
MKTFRQAVQGKAFTVTADLTLQSHSDADDVARQVDLLDPWVDAIKATDNSWSDVQMPAVAAAARVLRPADGWAAKSLKERSGAGARFLQTQLCFNLDILRQYMACLVAKHLTWNFSVIVSLAPMLSAEKARWLKKNLSGSRIPSAVIGRLEQAADPEREGIEICPSALLSLAGKPRAFHRLR